MTGKSCELPELGQNAPPLHVCLKKRLAVAGAADEVAELFIGFK